MVQRCIECRNFSKGYCDQKKRILHAKYRNSRNNCIDYKATSEAEKLIRFLQEVR